MRLHDDYGMCWESVAKLLARVSVHHIKTIDTNGRFYETTEK